MKRFALAVNVVMAAGCGGSIAQTPPSNDPENSLMRCFGAAVLGLDDGRSDPIAVARGMLTICSDARYSYAKHLISKITPYPSQENVSSAMAARRDLDIDIAIASVLVSRKQNAAVKQ